MSPPLRKSRHAHVKKQKAQPGSPRAFEILPIRQSIAGYLDDKSIASYRLICRSTKNALDEDEGSFWRTQFLETYDPSKQTPTGTRFVVNGWFKEQYQCRKRIERQRFDFQTGNSQKEMECLSLLKDLINESFNTNPRKSKQATIHSLNMDRLEKIVKATSLLECVFRRPYVRSKKSTPNPTLLAIQLCWTKPLSTTPLKLGKHWKGSYAYVEHDELFLIRDGQNEDYPIPDHMSGDGTDQPFQDLCLDFPEEDLDFWPEIFEQILKSRTKIRYRTATTRAQKRVTGPHVLPESEPVSFCFKGQGEDAREGFLASGYFNPLPPQHGIPGWHRMTMMKYWKDEHGQMDYNSLWAYEGVVLPGGMVMLGRWWHPSDDGEEYSGPFIFWNVDASVPGGEGQKSASD
ncbi:hypothetical protein KCU71_g10815, partial [Aureobasidium melanogenum]